MEIIIEDGIFWKEFTQEQLSKEEFIVVVGISHRSVEKLFVFSLKIPVKKSVRNLNWK